MCLGRSLLVERGCAIPFSSCRLGIAVLGIADLIGDPFIMLIDVAGLPIIRSISAGARLQALHPVNLGMEVAPLLPIRAAVPHVVSKSRFQRVCAAFIAEASIVSPGLSK